MNPGRDADPDMPNSRHRPQQSSTSSAELPWGTIPAPNGFVHFEPSANQLSAANTIAALKTNLIPLPTDAKAIAALEASVEQASHAQRAFGIRASLVANRVKAWHRELSAWEWPALSTSSTSRGFEEPDPEERAKRQLLAGPDTERGGSDQVQKVENVDDFASATFNGELEEYWGSLPARTVLAHEKRVADIRHEMAELDVESLKEQVLDAHVPCRSRPTSSEGPEPFQTLSNITPLDDFTALTSATLIRALPDIERLNRLLVTWSTRHAVLRKIPSLLNGLAEAHMALRSGWNAIGSKERGLSSAEPGRLPSQLRLHDGVERSNMEDYKGQPAIRAESTSMTTADSNATAARRSFNTMRSILEEKISTLGQLLDSMLDALEYGPETVPDQWISQMESIEGDYAEWVVSAEKIVLECEWRQQAHAQRIKFDSSLATRPTNITSPSHDVALSSTGQSQEAEPIELASVAQSSTSPSSPSQESSRRPSLVSRFNTSSAHSVPKVLSFDAEEDNLPATTEHIVSESTREPLRDLQLASETIPGVSVKNSRIGADETPQDRNTRTTGNHADTDNELGPDPDTESFDGLAEGAQLELIRSKSSVMPETHSFVAEDQQATGYEDAHSNSRDLRYTESKSMMSPVSHDETEGGCSDLTRNSESPVDPHSPMITSRGFMRSDGSANALGISIPRSPDDSRPDENHRSLIITSHQDEYILPSEQQDTLPVATIQVDPVRAATPTSTLVTASDLQSSGSTTTTYNAPTQSDSTWTKSTVSAPAARNISSLLDMPRSRVETEVGPLSTRSSASSITLPTFRPLEVPPEQSFDDTESNKAGKIIAINKGPNLSSYHIRPESGFERAASDGFETRSTSDSNKNESQSQGTHTSPTLVSRKPSLDGLYPSIASENMTESPRSSPPLLEVDGYFEVASPPLPLSPPDLFPDSRRSSGSIEQLPTLQWSENTKEQSSSANLQDVSNEVERGEIGGPRTLLAPELGDQLEQKISSILTSIPADIRITSEDAATQVGKTRKPSLGLHVAKRKTKAPVTSRSSTPAPTFTLAAAPTPKKAFHHFHRTKESRTNPSSSEVRLYHLRRTAAVAAEAPIKLFVRQVGENGERVMVRVGGGWADLGEYLREYASHHGSSSRRAVSEGKMGVEITQLSTPGSTDGDNRSIRGSGRVTPSGVRPGSALSARPRFDRSMRVSSASSPITPSVMRNGIPLGLGNTPSSIASSPPLSASGAAWTKNETPSPIPFGLGDNARKGGRGDERKLSKEKQAWVDGMTAQVRRVTSGGVPTVGEDVRAAKKKETVVAAAAAAAPVDFGELETVGATKRVFRRKA